MKPSSKVVTSVYIKRDLLLRAKQEKLMGHSVRGDVDSQHYAFHDEDDLRRIYNQYWSDFRILD